MRVRSASWVIGGAVALLVVTACSPTQQLSGAVNQSREAAVASLDTSTTEGACGVIATYEADFATTTSIIESNLATDPVNAQAGYTSLSLQYHEAATRVEDPELKAHLASSATAYGTYGEYQTAVVEGTEAAFDKDEVLTAAKDLATSSAAINSACGTAIGVTSVDTPVAASTAPSPSAASGAGSPSAQADGDDQVSDCALIKSYEPQLIEISNTTQAALEKDPAGAAAGYQRTAALYEEMASKVTTAELKAALEQEQAAMTVYYKYQKSTAAGNLGANSYDKVTAAAKKIAAADKVIHDICGSAS